jgi:hypothetical protein
MGTLVCNACMAGSSSPVRPEQHNDAVLQLKRFHFLALEVLDEQPYLWGNSVVLCIATSVAANYARSRFRYTCFVVARFDDTQSLRDPMLRRIEIMSSLYGGYTSLRPIQLLSNQTTWISEVYFHLQST